MTRFALTLEYDGRPFMGWQHQDHGPSVQQAVEESIKKITGQTVRVFAAGRTDAGVHALAMRAHFDRGLSWQVAPVLDAEAMHGAAQVLIGQHDFTTFRSAHCQAQSPVKTLDSISVSRFGDEIEVEVSARSFLHHQVRSIVGCLKLVGTGTWSKADLKNALVAKDRNALGFNAPPDGLYFVEALYPAESKTE